MSARAKGPYVLVERGEHTTRRGTFPFTHFFKERGPFYLVMTSRSEEAAKFRTIASAKRIQQQLGLRKHVIEPLDEHTA